MTNKTAIYTAIFGEKDVIKEPINYRKNENVDYFLITDDQNLKSACYNIIYKKPIYDDITKNARYYKIKGLEEFKSYDFIIWHDANLQINHEEIVTINTFAKNKEIAIFKHSDRNCIYDEAIKCIQLEKDYPFIILKQIYGYYRSGIKPNSGLYDTSIVVKNSKLIGHEFLDLWWSEIRNKSRRDQLSLPYALQAFNIEPGIIEGRRENNRFTLFSKHHHQKYHFLSLNEPKSVNKWYKAIVLKLIAFLKR